MEAKVSNPQNCTRTNLAEFEGDKNNIMKGIGGGWVLSVLPLYFDEPSLNPAEVFYFYCVNCFWKEWK